MTPKVHLTRRQALAATAAAPLAGALAQPAAAAADLMGASPSA